MSPANNALLSKSKAVIPIICSGGSFDFVGGSPGAKVGKGEAEGGIFFYQQADYSSKGWRYDSGTLREAAVVTPGGFYGGYGQIKTGQGTERWHSVEKRLVKALFKLAAEDLLAGEMARSPWVSMGRATLGQLRGALDIAFRSALWRKDAANELENSSRCSVERDRRRHPATSRGSWKGIHPSRWFNSLLKSSNSCNFHE